MNEHIDLSSTAMPGAAHDITLKPGLDPGMRPDISLQQTDYWQRIQRCFELYANGVIAIADQRSGQAVLLACEFIQSPLRKQWCIPRLSMTASIVSLCTLLVSVASQQPLSTNLAVAGIVIVCAVLTVLRTTVRYSLQSVGGNITLASLSGPLYKRAPLYAFATRLQALIEQQQSGKQPPLPALVAEHRRLVTERLITAADYDKAKDQLFRKQQTVR